MMTITLLYTAGLLVLSLALRTFENRLLRKLGGIVWLGASAFAAYRLSEGSAGWAVVGALAWFFLPLLEILGRIRQLLLPLKNQMKPRHPPNREQFAELRELTGEIEAEGFAQADDLGCDWEETRHFLRVFYHEERRQRAVINLMQTGTHAFYYTSVSSETLDGRQFMTWDFPFAYSMSFPPALQVLRADDTQQFAQLQERHQAFLLREGIGEKNLKTLEPDDLRQVIEEEVGAQISHNLNSGLIEKVNDTQFRYSWKGCMFLWYQFVKDMIRL